MEKNTEINTLTLAGEEVPYMFCYLSQAELQFYPENPRIYSVVYTNKETPSQAEIQEKLANTDHVKELVQSIEANKGLIEPLWVRDSDYVVLEGNNRLAAYRILAQKDAIKWGKVKCHLLPKDIDDKKIFSFLCQCHVIGKQDWAPYEEAGMVWRRNKIHGDSPENMAKEMGKGISYIKHLIKVYSFMDDHGDKEVHRWSFYDQYLKSRKIQGKREEYPKLDSIIVNRVKNGEISRAEDIRDKVTKICGVGSNILETFIEKPKSLDECYEKAREKTEDTALYRTLYKFRVKIGDLDTRQSLEIMGERQRKKCKYEIQKIRDSASRLLRTLR